MASNIVLLCYTENSQEQINLCVCQFYFKTYLLIQTVFLTTELLFEKLEKIIRAAKKYLQTPILVHVYEKQ